MTDRFQYALAVSWLVIGVSFAEGADNPPWQGVAASSLPAQAISTEPVDMVQSELDMSILENLPAPAALPPGVRPLQVIIGKGQWQGSQCGITRPAQLVFRKSETWTKFWTLAMSPYASALAKIPTVDFSKDMVVGVFMGERHDPHYAIQILSTDYEQRGPDRVLVVRYRDVQKMTGVFNPPFAVQPFHLKKLPVFTGPILFQKVKR